MTWNLWWQFGDHRLRENAIVKVIADHAPDVICLQEIWVERDAHQAQMLADRLQMHWVATDPVFWNDRSFGNAILSRWPITRVRDQRLPGADGQLTHRRMVLAEVHTPWGQWPVLSTHLEHRFDHSATRSAQITAVSQAIAEYAAGAPSAFPVLMGADLNAVPDSDEIRMMTGKSAPPVPGLVMSDVWEQVGQGLGLTWRRENPHVEISAWPDRRIDYLMVAWPRPKPVGNPISAQLIADQPVEIDGQLVWASDHAAIIAELQTPEVTSPEMISPEMISPE